MNTAPALCASAALVYASLRSVLNVCHRHTAPSIDDATASPSFSRLALTQISGTVFHCYFRNAVLDGILTNISQQYVRDFILVKFQLLAVVSLPQCAFAHFGAGVKASIIFVRKRRENEKQEDDESIFMAAPEQIGYDATGRETESQFDDIIKKYEEFQQNPELFFAYPPMLMNFAFSLLNGGIKKSA